MAEKEYIEREAFLEQKREQYCKYCARRKGMRNGKYKTLYEIGKGPCRACEIDDVLNDVEDFPAADVRPVVRGKWTGGKCDQCGKHAPYWCMATTYYRSNFCPNCGADMREES